MRNCHLCKQSKPLDEFVKDKSRPQGRGYRCYPCSREYNASIVEDPEKKARRLKLQRERRRADPEGTRRAYLKKQYGMTLEDYMAMHDAQNGLCWVCTNPETNVINGTKCWLAVDHNHETGKVRALLCSLCNAGIGKLQDDADLLRKAIEYLEYFSE